MDSGYRPPPTPHITQILFQSQDQFSSTKEKEKPFFVQGGIHQDANYPARSPYENFTKKGKKYYW